MHKVEFLGKDTPGAGAYDTDTQKIYKMLKKSSISGNKFC